MKAQEFREVGHRMVDLLSEYLEHIEERPLFAKSHGYPRGLHLLRAQPKRRSVHERSGRLWISITEMKGWTWFRINPVNFRTRPEHDELFTLLGRECEGAAQGKKADREMA